MNQMPLDWSAATSLPIAGKTRAARHASAVGSVIAARHFGRKVLRYCELLAAAGTHGLSDHAAVALLEAQGLKLAGVNSINSLRNSLGDFVEHTGEFESTQWNTKRGRYRFSAAGRAWMNSRGQHG